MFGVAFIAQHSTSPRYALADPVSTRDADTGVDRRGRMRERACASPRDELRAAPAGSAEPNAPHPTPIAERLAAKQRARVRCSREFGGKPRWFFPLLPVIHHQAAENLAVKVAESRVRNELGYRS